MTDKELIALAFEAKGKAYSPYSGFSVGAALLCADGSVFYGCNIENAAYSPSVCAERTAIFSAVANGKRGFTAIAVVGDKNPCPPCGVCRQVMSEFCGIEFKIIVAKSENEYIVKTLGELLPMSFSKETL